MRHPWDVFEEIQIMSLTGFGYPCQDCSFASTGKNDADYKVMFTFRGDAENFYYVAICEDHIAYWRKLVEIHREGQHATD